MDHSTNISNLQQRLELTHIHDTSDVTVPDTIAVSEDDTITTIEVLYDYDLNSCNHHSIRYELSETLDPIIQQLFVVATDSQITATEITQLSLPYWQTTDATVSLAMQRSSILELVQCSLINKIPLYPYGFDYLMNPFDPIYFQPYQHLETLVQHGKHLNESYYSNGLQQFRSMEIYKPICTTCKTTERIQYLKTLCPHLRYILMVLYLEPSEVDYNPNMMKTDLAKIILPSPVNYNIRDQVTDMDLHVFFTDKNLEKILRQYTMEESQPIPNQDSITFLSRDLKILLKELWIKHTAVDIKTKHIVNLCQVTHYCERYLRYFGIDDTNNPMVQYNWNLLGYQIVTTIKELIEATPNYHLLATFQKLTNTINVITQINDILNSEEDDYWRYCNIGVESLLDTLEILDSQLPELTNRKNRSGTLEVSEGEDHDTNDTYGDVPTFQLSTGKWINDEDYMDTSETTDMDNSDTSEIELPDAISYRLAITLANLSMQLLDIVDTIRNDIYSSFLL